MRINRILATGLIFLTPVFSQNVSPKLAKDLPDVDSRVVTDVIVQFTNPADDEQHRNIASLGGRFKADLGLIKSAVYSLPAAALPALARMPNVDYVSPDREVEATLDYAGRPLVQRSRFNPVWMELALESPLLTAGSWRPAICLRRTRIALISPVSPTARTSFREQQASPISTVMEPMLPVLRPEMG